MSETLGPRSPSWSDDHRVRAALAYAAVPGALLALVVVWAVAPLAGDGLVRVDGISRWLQAGMTAVIGFYFGQIGTRRAEERAQLAEVRAMRAVEGTDVSSEDVDLAETELDRLEVLLDRLRTDPEIGSKVEVIAQKMKEGRS